MLELCAFKAAYIVDIVALVALVIFALKDARKGFVGCLFGFLTTLIAFILAIVLADDFIGWTGNFFGLQPKLESGIVNKLSSIKGFDIDVSVSGLKTALEGVNLPSFIADAIVSEFGDSTIPAGTTVAMLAGGKIASILVTLISGVVVFFATKLLLGLLARILNKVVSSIPLVGGVNTLLGAAVGFLKAFLLICTVLSLLSLIPSEGITNFFSKTLFVGKLMQNNPLGYILSWITV